jgi:uncharacterized protein YigE (DUF2233 family)
VKKSFLLFFIASFFLSATLHAEWKTLAPGFDYRTENNVHFFKIDPQKFRIDLLLSSHYGMKSLTADEYRKKSRALLVINGGFFDELYRSLGLLETGGKVVNPVKKAGWGVFVLKGDKGNDPALLLPKDWTGGGRMAIQAGPRLVIDGQLTSLKSNAPSRRSAIGITPGNSVEIAISERLLTLQEWGSVLQKDCIQALNLDGGGSSQISVVLPNFSLNMTGETGVPNAVAVFEK